SANPGGRRACGAGAGAGVAKIPAPDGPPSAPAPAPQRGALQASCFALTPPAHPAPPTAPPGRHLGAHGRAGDTGTAGDERSASTPARARDVGSHGEPLFRIGSERNAQARAVAPPGEIWHSVDDESGQPGTAPRRSERPMQVTELDAVTDANWAAFVA